MASAVATPPVRELVLGRYRPLRPLGTGGSGSVWLALDERSGLAVALKIVARDGKSGQRAEREAAAAARLRHERCLRAYACASDRDHVYIAYEYVPGRTLRERMRAGELGDAAAVEAAAQILDGLAHAHERGVVHRDVKPANVLLADGDAISVRLLDFGLAQFAEADTLTAAGDVPGTLAYIAPERLRGEEASAASDVWSVGVLLWEALAGTHPFWGTPLLETARSIEAGAPPLSRHRPDLPTSLLAAIDRALSVDPARRPSAAELASALRASLEERARNRVPRPNVRLAAPGAARAAVPAALAALVAGWSAAALPFYPSGFPVLLAALAALAAAVRPRIGLAFALAVPVFPLGNISLGLALLYSAVAAAWTVLVWRRPRDGLAFAAGPPLAFVGALAVLPLVLERAGGSVRRVAHAFAAVLAAAVVTGVHGERRVPLDVARAESPTEVAGELLAYVRTQPKLLLLGLALAITSAALPYARRFAPWGLPAVGVTMVALTAAGFGLWPAVLVFAAWSLCSVAVARERAH